MVRTYVRLAAVGATLVLAGTLTMLAGCAPAPKGSAGSTETPAVQQLDPTAPADAAQNAVDNANRAIQDQGQTDQQ
jgi:hypothetical protein